MDLFLGGRPSYPVKLPDEELGYYHLGPVEWDTLEGFSTPITLLAMLSSGKMEDTGIEVIDHDSPLTIYEVEGYDEDSVEIHDLFLKFIVDITKGKSLSQGLFAAGVVDKMTASLTESKALIPLSKKESIQVEQGKNTDNNAAVIQALEALGYKKSEGIQMVDKAQLCEGMSLEEKVQAVLKSLGDSN